MIYINLVQIQDAALVIDVRQQECATGVGNDDKALIVGGVDTMGTTLHIDASDGGASLYVDHHEALLGKG